MYKKLQLFFAILLPLIAGCTTTGDSGSVTVREYQIKVDSMDAPATAPASDTLNITLHGTVGPTGCYQLDHFEKQRQAGSLSLKVWGKQYDTICTQAFVEMHKEYQIAPPLKDAFEIRIEQPDGSVLTHTVRIQSP